MSIHLADRAGARRARRPSRFWAPRPTLLAALHEALAHDVVLVRGPAGVGKSALLGQLADDLVDDPDTEVQVISAAAIDGAEIDGVVPAFRDGTGRRVLMVDDLDDRDEPLTERLLDRLRHDPGLRIVVGTRYITRFEGPAAALDFDIHVIPSGDLLMTSTEVSAVLARNGVEFTAEAVEVLACRTSGWPALVQLACTHLRLEELPLRTPDEAATVGAYAGAAFTTELEARLGLPVTDEMRLLSVAPSVTMSAANAMGIDADAASSGTLLRALQDAGFLWPSRTRLALAEPVREQWMNRIAETCPELVETSRGVLLDRLVATGDPLTAAQFAADAGRWATLAGILRSAAPEVWARDATAFGRLVGALRTRATSDPVVWDTLLKLDPATVESAEAPSSAASALLHLPDARTSAATDLDKLVVRVSLLRAAGRFALASEAASLSSDALRRRDGRPLPVEFEGRYQVGMTHLAMGRLRDASHALEAAYLCAEPAERLRCQGVRAVVALIDGDVAGADEMLDDVRGSTWMPSPWGEGARLAEAWLALERGRPDETRAALAEASAAPQARELWPYAAALHAHALLLSGAASDGLGALRAWNGRASGTPPSHFQSSQLSMARAKVFIALRQARRSISLFDGPFSVTSTTAPSIALAHLYAGRPHDAYVTSTKWGVNQELSPRAALESLIVSAVADIRLNGTLTHRSTLQRAESISRRHGLWTPWSAIAPEDREPIFGMLSDDVRAEVSSRRSFFASSVSVPHLTRRERVVLARLTPTSTIAEIARALVVSPNTVKTQLQSLYRKLEVCDRASAIRAAHAWGLIESDVEM